MKRVKRSEESGGGSIKGRRVGPIYMKLYIFFNLILYWCTPSVFSGAKPHTIKMATLKHYYRESANHISPLKVTCGGGVFTQPTSKTPSFQLVFGRIALHPSCCRELTVIKHHFLNYSKLGVYPYAHYQARQNVESYLSDEHRSIKAK